MIRALLLSVAFGVVARAAQNTPGESLQDALDAFNANVQQPFNYHVIDRLPSDFEDGGIAILEMRSRATDEPVLGLVELAVVVPVGASWSVYLPGDDAFVAAYASLPYEIVSAIDIEARKPQADPDLLPRIPYGLPFPHAAFGTVTRSYAEHGTGLIDFDLTGPDVAAAKSGTIIYVNDAHTVNGPWWYWNTVIIQHGEHEYSLYAHLAPDSVPDSVKMTCYPVYDRPNCDFPIKRGDVIGAEGNTGRSSNPHLHLEFGQSLNFVAFPDTKDDDDDGDRFEPVWTAFLYQEQNAPIAGYSPNEVENWAWGRVEQAGHQSAMPMGGDVIWNGGFADETNGWRPVGQLNWSVENEILHVLRLRGADGLAFASFYQFLNYSVYAGHSFEASLDIGNSSGVPKLARVELLSAAGQAHGSFGCTFQVAPGASLARYTVRGSASNTWANALFRVSVEPADGSPALLIDNVSLTRVPTPHTVLECTNGSS